MTRRTELPRPVPAIRLSVVGHRDLEGVDRSVLRATVTRFLGQLRGAVDESLAKLGKEADPDPYTRKPPLFFLVDPLAEGADQLVAETAVEDSYGYRLRCPIPFTASEYKSFFTHDAEHSVSTFDRLVGDPNNEAVLIELACRPSEAERGAGYAAAADVLLDNSDLLLALYDPSRVGSTGGTAETLAKAMRSGLPVIGVDLRSPENLEALRAGAGGQMRTKPLTPQLLNEIVCGVLLPPGLCGRVQTTDASQNQIARLHRYLREPLITGGPVTRSFAKMLHAVYRGFWLAVPALGSIAARLRPGHHRDEDDLPTPSMPSQSAHLRTIEAIQRPYLGRMAPVDRLAGFYMSLYQGSFVMNFFLGAMAVLFALLAYFNLAHQWVWLWAEVIALSMILANFVASRAWAWHERALDYRFVAEYLRQTTMLAPLGRVAPLIRPSAQYHGHDPWATWMGWYVRALHRDQGLVDFQAPSARKVLRMDEGFLSAMRFRMCEDWLKDQYRYYRAVERRFEAAARAVHALMALLFIIAMAAVAAHLVGVTIDLDETAWRKGALLTMMGAIPPAFLGALHGIAVQGELDLTAGRARDMAAYLARRVREMAQPATQPECAAAVLLSSQAVEAAHTMLDEVLDWRIIHQANQVELA